VGLNAKSRLSHFAQALSFLLIHIYILLQYMHAGKSVRSHAKKLKIAIGHRENKMYLCIESAD
jgi:hypothetical protein